MAITYWSTLHGSKIIKYTMLLVAEAVSLVNGVLGRAGDKAYIDANQSKILHLLDISSDHWAYYDIIEATNSHKAYKDDKTELWTALS